MKIERLLAIITYLLNRDLVSGKHLAEKFEVSERTIQRDVEAINMAGIPIVSIRGRDGGYQILDTYKLSKQTSTKQDLSALKVALESLTTAIDHSEASNTLEKVNSLGATEDKGCISLDFGIAKENAKVTKYIKKIEEAIQNQKRVEFDYSNSSGHESHYIVEPVSMKFKWYAWYLVGYAVEKAEYRIFKLVRMKTLIQSEMGFSKTHIVYPELFDEIMSHDKRGFTRLCYKFKKKVYSSFMEHFHKAKITFEDELYYYGEHDIIESERLWLALILSFGDDVEIIEPAHIRNRIYEHAKKVEHLYQNTEHYFTIPDR